MSNPETPGNFQVELIKRLEKQLAAADLKRASIQQHLQILRDYNRK